MLQLERDIAHLLSCRWNGDARPEQPRDLKKMIIALKLIRCGKSKRNPQFGPIREAKAKRHDAKYAIGHPVQLDRSPHNVWVGSVALLPDPGADENNGAPGLILVCRKVAPKERLDTEKGQQVRGDSSTVNFRGPVISGDGEDISV